MTKNEVSDRVGDIEYTSKKLGAIIDVLSCDLAQVNPKDAGLEFSCRTEMYCSLIDIAADLLLKIIPDLKSLNDELNKETPAPTKVTGEKQKTTTA